MDDNEDYVAFDDDAEEAVATEEDSKKGKKKRKMKVDREGSKKNKKAKGKRGKFLKTLVIGGLVLSIATSLFIDKRPDVAKPTSDQPQDDYYLTVNFTDVENVDLDDLFIYSEGDIHTLVYQTDDSEDVVSVCDSYVIPEGAIDDGSHALTPLEGTKLLDSIIDESNVIMNAKVDGLSLVGSQYHISVDNDDVRDMLKDSDCAMLIDSYTDLSGESYENLSDYLEAKANGITKSK